MPAPVASGWSGCRVGLAPTGKRRLVTAHTRCGPSEDPFMPKSDSAAKTKSARSVKLGDGMDVVADIANGLMKEHATA